MAWFQSKSTPKDRATTAMMGAWAGIWLGITFIFIYTNPVPITSIFWSAVIGSMLCLLIGAISPKYVRIIFFPFCLFSIGGIS